MKTKQENPKPQPHLLYPCVQSSGHASTSGPPGSASCSTPLWPRSPSAGPTWISGVPRGTPLVPAPWRSWSSRPPMLCPGIARCSCGAVQSVDGSPRAEAVPPWCGGRWRLVQGWGVSVLLFPGVVIWTCKDGMDKNEINLFINSLEGKQNMNMYTKWCKIGMNWLEWPWEAWSDKVVTLQN